MKEYTVNSNAYVFNGNRLIFTAPNMPTKTRNELGKNGVTIHNYFASLFYRTIKIKTNDGQIYYVNRSSLIKFVGLNPRQRWFDNELVGCLEITGQEPIVNNPNFRHAGEHNQH